MEETGRQEASSSKNLGRRRFVTVLLIVLINQNVHKLRNYRHITNFFKVFVKIVFIMDLNKLKVPELRKELQARGLDSKGNKPVLVERLREAIEKEQGTKAMFHSTLFDSCKEGITRFHYFVLVRHILIHMVSSLFIKILPFESIIVTASSQITMLVILIRPQLS